MQLSYILVQAFGWIQGAYTVIISTIRNVKSRKTVLFFSIVGLFCLYLTSSYLLPAHRHFHVNQVQQRQRTKSCLDSYLEKWSLMMANSDAVFKVIPESSTENRFFPFAGNGHIGFSMDGYKYQFYLIADQTSINIPIIPVITAELVEKSSNKQQAVILNIKEGSVHTLTSYMANKSCIVVEELFYAHRLHKDLFFHEINIRNSGMFPVTFKFNQLSNDKQLKPIKRITKSEVKYSIAHATIQDFKKNSNKQVKLTTGFSDFQPTIRVPQKSQNKVSMLSMTKYEIVDKPKKEDKRTRKSTANTVNADDELTKFVIKELFDVMNITPDTLHKQHQDAWNELWKVGVRIGSESDPDSPSSLHVNLTEYYIYSTLLYNRSISTEKKIDCFHGPPTLHNAELWVIPSNMKTLEKLKDTWNTLFVKSGCMSKDASSLLIMRESMVLSFMGLQYEKHHLQLALNPLNLWSNISVRSLSMSQFNSQDSLDLEIRINKKTSERSLHVTCTGSHKPIIYGCSTACDKVVQLGSSTLNFPVHTTDPVTPLFYISTNHSHLEHIGETSFMRAAKQNAKTAHQSHLEVHHLKLSPKFWLAVVILIISFHVIVIKMIYNECRSNRGAGRRRSPFNS